MDKDGIAIDVNGGNAREALSETRNMRIMYRVLFWFLPEARLRSELYWWTTRRLQ